MPISLPPQAMKLSMTCHLLRTHQSKSIQILREALLLKLLPQLHNFLILLGGGMPWVSGARFGVDSGVVEFVVLRIGSHFLLSLEDG